MFKRSVTTAVRDDDAKKRELLEFSTRFNDLCTCVMATYHTLKPTGMQASGGWSAVGDSWRCWLSLKIRAERAWEL